MLLHCSHLHRAMATTVSVILGGLVKTVRMTSMNVTQILVAMLAPVLILSMDTIASVHLDLQVWNSFWLPCVLCLVHVGRHFCVSKDDLCAFNMILYYLHHLYGVAFQFASAL